MKPRHLIGGAAALAAAVAIAAPASAGAATPRFVGSISACSSTVGSVVAVNFAGANVAPYGQTDDWGGPVALGCDTKHPAHGINLPTDTGFTTAGDNHDGPAFICRIGSPLFHDGTQYPTPAQDPCVVTPPASAYWSYWLADAGQNTWTYSPLGAYSDVPKTGEVEAWTFGGTDIAGTTGQPPFTPQQVRDQETAGSSGGSTGGGGSTGSGGGSGSGGTGSGGAGSGGSGGSGSGSGGSASGGSGSGGSSGGSGSSGGGSSSGSGSSGARAHRRSASRRPSLSRGVRYLVTTTGANGLSKGTSLRKDGYYESTARFADFGLTIDGAYALAATRSDRDVLRRIVSFIGSRRKDGSGRSVNTWTEIGTKYANGGSIGKEALLAEVVGRNPRRFAGHNLIATLGRLLCTRHDAKACAGGAGSYAYGSSTFDQALAIMAQLRARDAGHAKRAIAFLQRQQHRNGAWPSLIPSTGDSEVDSTAMAAMALALVHGKQAAKAVARADGWIRRRQERDGGFPGASGDSTNSTALAIQAMKLKPRTYAKPIARALSFLAAEQNSDGGFNVAAKGKRGSDVRASTQVVGGIVGTSFGTLRAARDGRTR